MMYAKLTLCLSATLYAASALLTVNAQDNYTSTEKVSTRPSTSINAPKRIVSSPTVTHDYAWYEAKTYDWVDQYGVVHQASIVDEASDPYQIYDLLRWIYCNPEIPGTKYNGSSTTADGKTYYGEQRTYLRDNDRSTSDPGWFINNSDVTEPIEDGHTTTTVPQSI